MSEEQHTILNQLIALQKDRHLRLKRISINFKKDSSSRKTLSYYAERCRQLKELQAQFEDTHEKIITTNIDDQHEYLAKDKMTEFQELFLDVLCEIQDSRDRSFPKDPNPSISLGTSLHNNTTSCSHSSSIQFAPIPAPVFSGKFIDWPKFHDAFTQLIHSNNELSGVQKFHYLKKSLPSDRDVDIHSMLMCDNSYITAWELLNKRYNNARILFSHHMNALYELPTLVKEESDSLKLMLNVTTVCISEFRRLGIPIDSCDHWISHYISTKLSKETHSAWERHLGASMLIPTFNELESFLTSRLFTIDAIENRSNPHHVIHNHATGNKNSKSTTKNTFHLQKHGSLSTCVLCQQPHVLRRCPTFLSKDCFSRKDIVLQHKICLNCLSNAHLLPQCTSTKNCQQCGRRHHTLLHFTTQQDVKSAPRIEETNQMIPPVSTTTRQITSAHANVDGVSSSRSITGSSTNITVLLPTAIVQLCNPVTNRQMTFCALIDQGSEGTIVSEYVVQSLQLPRHKATADISGVGENSSKRSRHAVSFDISSEANPSFVLHIERAQVLSNLNILLPSKSVLVGIHPHIKDLNLADPHYHRPKRIDVIIGADYYPSLILPQIKFGTQKQPIAQNTNLGWILSGQASTSSNINTKIHCHTTLIELETLLNKFYESEQVLEENRLSAQDQWCEEYFRQSTVRHPNGKYMVRLPLKSIFDPNQTLGRSKQIAFNRFLKLERRFQQNPSFFKEYSDVINDYFQLGQIKPVPNSSQGTLNDSHQTKPINVCTLPHQAVIKEESLTTKLRVVFDASTKTSNGRSLNDVLCVGPPLQNDLAAVLLNWRLHKYVYLADIKKMYRCIDMHSEDSQYQRILWRKDDTIQEFALTTVTFGTASAPFQAIRVLHQLAEDEEDRYPLASKILRKDIYVDDVLSGSDTLETAISCRNQLIDALRSAGMELRKWSSNHVEMLNNIPLEHQSVHPNLLLNGKDSVKTLGLHWCPTSDTLTFHIKFEIPKTITKRTLLSMIARLFDPLGLIIPVLLPAKLIMKEVWKLKETRDDKRSTLDWDDPLPIIITKKWQQLVTQIAEMNVISVPRWLNFVSKPDYIEIHAFCDGSSSSYAAAVYLRLKTANTITCHLLAAKNRVTPAKLLTIPRIELCGAVLAVQLANWVQNSLHGRSITLKTYYWSDASIILYWIHGEPSRWQTFVSNRVSKILSTSEPKQWNHVSTKDNPADCATRGLTPRQLANFELWWNGPSWLQLSQEHWPTFQLDRLTINVLETEERPPKLRIHHCSVDDFIIHRYSTLRKLVRVTAWVFRFYHNCKPHASGQFPVQLTVTELQDSLAFLIGIVQQSFFRSEIHALRNSNSLPINSKLRSLVPFIDNRNLLRVKGRLENSTFPYDQKHPIILPPNHHLTGLIIDNEHFNTLHGGTQLTLAKIRQKFWILNARKTVRSRLSRCIRCYKNKPTPITQLMGDLPAHRVTPYVRPFISAGVDYTGALTLKASKYRGHTVYKGYIAIFICLATKAIHLEAVTGLDTEHFLMALQRFFSRRGICHDIYSDCGTNFTGADNILQFSQKSLMSKLADKGITWHFNPPYSPNFGGLWEANVKATKYHLRRVIGETRLTYEELSTILTEIEACLNSRPLCPLTSDTDDLFVLTPAHFLITDSLLAQPEIPQSTKGLSRQFFELKKLVNQFWKRWSCDWLSHLQARPKWRLTEVNLQPDELVLIRDDNLPPNQWMLGRVLQTHPGSDQLVRVVTLRTKNGVIKRSIAKLCRLPTPNPESSNINPSSQ